MNDETVKSELYNECLEISQCITEFYAQGGLKKVSILRLPIFKKIFNKFRYSLSNCCITQLSSETIVHEI